MSKENLGTERQPAVDTFSESLREWARRQPEARAVTTSDTSVTYGELDRLVDQLASALRSSGIRPGDRFAVLAGNGVPIIAAHYAASRTSSIMVGLNWRLTAPEIGALLDDCRPALTLVDPDLLPLVEGNSSAGELIEIGTREWDGWLHDSDTALTQATAPSGGDPMMMFYTNGTTGVPKGVLLTNTNIVTMVHSVGRRWNYSPTAHLLGILPLFHIGATGAIMSMLAAGGRVTLPADAKAQTFVDILERERITHSAMVPTVLNDLTHLPGIERADLSSLQVMVYGAAPAGTAAVAEAMALMPQCGFTQAYGLTESTGSVAIAPMLRHGDRDDTNGTVGRAVDHYEIIVVDPESHESRPAEVPGEVWVRGPQNAMGYWNRPEETSATFLPDGWLRTGDIGYLDSGGYLFIKDRLKDMIITGGENVYPAEVENVLTTHPDVLEAAVIGVPHERWGETVKAFVALAESASLTEESLIAYARTRLAGYKTPKVVEFISVLPRTATGKIHKLSLRR